MQPGAWPVAATPVAAGGVDDTHVFAATQETAADMILSTATSLAVPLTDATRVAIAVSYQDIAIATASAIAVTVQ